MTIAFSHIEIIKILLLTFILLLIGNIISVFWLPSYGYKIYRFFDFDSEQSIPTLFSVIILFISAILFYLIYKFQRIGSSKKYWLLLTYIFFFFAIDEAVSIHEGIGNKLMGKIELGGIFCFADYSIWVRIVTFCIILLKFVLTLPKKISFWLLLSGFIYVSGAIGMEMIGGYIAEKFPLNFEKNYFFRITYTIEESLEILGIICLIYTQLIYIISLKCDDIKIKIQ